MKVVTEECDVCIVEEIDRLWRKHVGSVGGLDYLERLQTYQNEVDHSTFVNQRRRVVVLEGPANVEVDGDRVRICEAHLKVALQKINSGGLP